MKHDVETSELRIARLIRVVVFTSGFIILLGLILYFATGTSGYADGVFPLKPVDIVQGLAALKPYAIIMTGILVLILTPFLRVAVSVFVFLREKDYLYVGITSLVLVILIVSIFIGVTQ